MIEADINNVKNTSLVNTVIQCFIPEEVIDGRQMGNSINFMMTTKI